MAPGDPRLAPLLSQLDDLARAAIDSTRRIVSDLRPRPLDNLDFPQALDALVAAYGGPIRKV